MIKHNEEKESDNKKKVEDLDNIAVYHKTFGEKIKKEGIKGRDLFKKAGIQVKRTQKALLGVDGFKEMGAKASARVSRKAEADIDVEMEKLRRAIEMN